MDELLAIVSRSIEEFLIAVSRCCDSKHLEPLDPSFIIEVFDRTREGSAFRTAIMDEVGRQLAGFYTKTIDPKEYSECFDRIPGLTVATIKHVEEAHQKAETSLRETTAQLHATQTELLVQKHALAATELQLSSKMARVDQLESIIATARTARENQQQASTSPPTAQDCQEQLLATARSIAPRGGIYRGGSNPRTRNS